MELQLSPLVDFSHELADAARAAILPHWRTRLAVESKYEPHRAIAESPVTLADREAERVMRAMISRRFPSHGVCGEEFGSEREEAEWVWVLDPIDGTKSFITGKPLFGTLVACLHHGEPVIGLIDQCVLNERWVGVRGRPTLLNGSPVRASGVSSLRDAMLYATTPHMFAPGAEASAFAALCAAVKRPLYGADCYAYALVASGFGADLVVEADLGLYDYCALVPVVEGAGGVMSDWAGERLTLRRHAASKGRVVAAANRALHAQAVALLREEVAAAEGWRRLGRLGRGAFPTLAAGVALGFLLARLR
ncbi:hypothetical protein AB1Y20_014345 [Prymnesium parvum]|uniref:histidinol-phosphatase n=1 Tax=Prymnesium parvum TaxID=97485 RepID=A0AB34IEY0_PRYPA